MNKGPIGIFDSGYGGLTVMKEVVRHPALQKYDYIYLGDNARAPYGNHSKETVTKYSEEAVNFLFNEGARLIIFACYTASSLALRMLQEKYLLNPSSKFKDRKILGVIRPIAEKAAKETRKSRIGVIGTRATINSKAFEIEIKNQNPNAVVKSQACPLLVPLIEEHWHQKPEARMVLKKYLMPLKSRHVDILILGCTHYPVMIKDFKRIMGASVEILNSGEIVAESLANYLARHPEMEAQCAAGGTRKFLTTDDPRRFEKFASIFGGIDIKSVAKISIGNL